MDCKSVGVRLRRFEPAPAIQVRGHIASRRQTGNLQRCHRLSSLKGRGVVKGVLSCFDLDVDSAEPTPVPMGEAMTADELVSRHTAAWQAATIHPFLAGVRDGSVSEDSFDRWLAQDYLYAQALVRAQSRIAAAAPFADVGLLALGRGRHRSGKPGADSSYPRIWPTSASTTRIRRPGASPPNTWSRRTCRAPRCYRNASRS
jgi:TENA/THI-4/PQQC family